MLGQERVPSGGSFPRQVHSAGAGGCRAGFAGGQACAPSRSQTQKSLGLTLQVRLLGFSSFSGLMGAESARAPNSSASSKQRP